MIWYKSWKNIVYPLLPYPLWGGLDWEEVKLFIEEKLGDIAGEMEIIVFEPKQK